MPIANIQSTAPLPWAQVRPPAQGVVVQQAPDVQNVSQTTRPALPPTQSYPNSDALFARQREQDDLARANETKSREAASNPKDQDSTTQRSPQQRPLAGGLTTEQLVAVNQLKARDTEVRQHEAAHQAAGGAYTGAASFTFTHGPDGKRYATGGEVSVDTSTIPGKPEQTIAKMRVIQQAALAPADPSPQDRRVAADAARIILQAQSELMAQREKTETRAANNREMSYQQRQSNAASAYRGVFLAETEPPPASGDLFALQV